MQTIQTGINNISSEWFKPQIDKKVLKKLSKRSDFYGWRHVITFFASLILLGILCLNFGARYFLFQFILLIVPYGMELMLFGMSVVTALLLKQEK